MKLLRLKEVEEVQLQREWFHIVLILILVIRTQFYFFLKIYFSIFVGNYFDNDWNCIVLVFLVLLFRYRVYLLVNNYFDNDWNFIVLVLLVLLFRYRVYLLLNMQGKWEY